MTTLPSKKGGSWVTEENLKVSVKRTLELACSLSADHYVITCRAIDKTYLRVNRIIGPIKCLIEVIQQFRLRQLPVIICRSSSDVLNLTCLNPAT